MLKTCLILLSISLSFLNSGCVIRLFFSTKQGKEKWKTEHYKLKVERRLDFAGPPYYRLKVKDKGLFHRYYKCDINTATKKECIYFIEDKDSLRIDFCKFTIDNEIYKKVKYKP